LVSRLCLFSWPEWISTHQRTNWPFCPSDGWSFSSSSWPYINLHCTIVSLFWLLAFDPLSWGVFPPTLTLLSSNLVTLVPSYLIDLAILLTYILALSITPYLCAFYLFVTKPLSWQKSYLFLVKFLFFS